MNKMKRILALLLALAMVAALCACGSQKAAESQTETSQAGETTTTDETTQASGMRTITDSLGREVELPETVETIVPLGNTPRMITYLGLADKVVGIGDCEMADSPMQAYAYVNKEAWSQLPIVGSDSMGETSYYPEELILAAPDVILCTYTKDVADDIQRQTNIPVVAVPDAVLFSEEYDQALTLLGDVCGVADRAAEVVSFIDACLEDLQGRTASIPEDQRPSVLAAAATFKGSHGIEGVYSKYAVFEAIAVNDVTTGMSDLSTGLLVDKEQILAWDPEVIFLDFSGLELVRQDYQENPAFYEQLQAFQNGRVYQCPNSTWHWSNVEIPLVSAYYMGSVLYPDAFQDVDFAAKASEIFEFFLGDGQYLTTLEEAGANYTQVTLGA